jgi:hypothetical protein
VDQGSLVPPREVGDLSHGEVLAVAQDQHCAGDDDGLVPSVVKPGPDQAGLVLVGKVDVQVCLVAAARPVVVRANRGLLPGARPDADSGASSIERGLGLGRVATVTLLDVGYSARTAQDITRATRAPTSAARSRTSGATLNAIWGRR